MNCFVATLMVFILWANVAHAQLRLDGSVHDAKGLPVEHATVYDVHLNKGASTDQHGQFSIAMPKGRHLLKVARIGYKVHEIPLQLTADTVLYIILEDEGMRLNMATVVADGALGRSRTQALAGDVVDEHFLRANNGNSLMKSLEKIPGVGAMEIGQGLSKPIIRGLGFNRVAVTENGIKQQGQQWGADHGLEIDQFGVERVEIVKGPMSLQYGSDAIGGVVSIVPLRKFADEGLHSSVLLNGKSNNQLVGGSLSSTYQHDGLYVQARATYQSYADYRVPADSFSYLGYQFPLHNGILKNTAGREQNLSLSAGLSGKLITSSLQLSNVYAKMGFFAGAHGIPSANNLSDDGNHRNIDLPYQSVNHFKMISNNELKLSDQQSVLLDIAYQLNHRQEYANPHNHGYSTMPQGNLELDLNLQTISANGKWNHAWARNVLSAGMTAEHQLNDIGGYSFLLPNFEQLLLGAFVINKYSASQKLTLTAGARYDRALLHIHQYIDPSIGRNFQRAPNLKLNLGDVSFALGAAYNATDWLSLKTNIGKSFRVPTANELASNGVHHGTFRYEIGDSTLTPETAYQFDASMELRSHSACALFNQLILSVNGFASYFPNFIFLQPTGEYDIVAPDGERITLPDVGQIYRYQQAKAFRTGGELQLVVDVRSWLRWEGSFEYVYALELDKRYPIPFTPPMSVRNELSFLNKRLWGMRNNSLSISYRKAAAQNRVRNELKTPGYSLFDVSLALHLPYKSNNKAVQIVVQVQNVFNTKYFNHMSFYRPLGLPEIGRNFTASLLVPF